MAKVTMSIDETLWHSFRVACLQRKTSASQEVSRLMHDQLGAWQAPHESPQPTRRRRGAAQSTAAQRATPGG